MYISTTSRILEEIYDYNSYVLKPSLAKFLFWLGVLAILALSVVPTNTLEAISSLDKAIHFFAFLVITYLLWAAYKLPRPFISSVLLLSLFGLTIELLQHFVPTRIFSLYDFAVDIAGIIAGVTLYWLLATRKVKS